MKGVLVLNKIGFIGAGNMGCAIMKGISKSSMSQQTELYAFDMDNEKVNALSEFGVKNTESANEICDKCDIVFLAVKPQVFEDVLLSVKEHVREETIFVSISLHLSLNSKS